VWMAFCVSCFVVPLLMLMAVFFADRWREFINYFKGVKKEAAPSATPKTSEPPAATTTTTTTDTEKDKPAVSTASAGESSTKE